MLKPSLFLAAALLATPAVADKSEPSADQLLEQAESIRNPQDDYTVQVELTERNEVRLYETMIKGRDKALVNFKKPEADRGKQVLMVGNEMWIYMPATAKPIRVSPRQKLAGNAAYGDVARLNFHGNYDAKIARREKQNNKDVIVLALKAKDGMPVTYSDIDYTIEAKTKYPVMAEYKTASGKVLKVGYFERFETVLGVTRPTVLRMVDQLTKTETTLHFMNAEKTPHPALMFEKQNLGRS